MVQKSRWYNFVVMNYTEETLKHIQEFQNVEYGMIGKETCPTTGTIHIHVVLYYKHPITLACAERSIHKEIPTAAKIEATISPQGSLAYASKDGDTIEFGKRPKQGKRNDINQVRDLLAAGANMRTITEIAPSFQSMKMAELYLKYHEPVRTWKPKVEWFWGGTGCGKTHEAFNILGYTCYRAMKSAKWWDGYDGQENVLIDEFRKDFCTFHELLALLDKYPMRVEIKGGTRQFLAKHIIITSCMPPHEVYETREDVEQLLRRIDNIRELHTRYIGTEVSGTEVAKES